MKSPSKTGLELRSGFRAEHSGERGEQGAADLLVSRVNRHADHVGASLGLDSASIEPSERDQRQQVQLAPEEAGHVDEVAARIFRGRVEHACVMHITVSAGCQQWKARTAGDEVVGVLLDAIDHSQMQHCAQADSDQQAGEASAQSAVCFLSSLTSAAPGSLRTEMSCAQHHSGIEESQHERRSTSRPRCPWLSSC